MKLNSAAVGYGDSLIKAGRVNIKAPWSFDAEAGNNLLGDPPDWKAYARAFLAVDPAADKETKAAFHYPFVRDGEIYRSGLIAIRSRSAQQGETDIFDQAGKWIAAIDKQQGEKATRYDASFWEWYYDSDQFVPKAIGGKILPIELSDGDASAPLLYKSFSSSVLNASVDGNENIVKLRVTVAKRDYQSDIIDPMGVDTSLWLRPNDKSPTGRAGIITWMHDLDSLNVARGLSWEPTAQYADIVQEYHCLTEQSRECRDMRKAGFLDQSSINVIPIQWVDEKQTSNDNVPVNPKNGNMVRTYTKSSLKEIADCNMGVNPYTSTLERSVRKAIAAGVIQSDGQTATWLTAITKKLPSSITYQPTNTEKTMTPEELQKAGAAISAKNKAHLETAGDHMDCAKSLHKAFGKAMADLHDKAKAIHKAVAGNEEPDEDDQKRGDVQKSLHKAIDKAFGKAMEGGATDNTLDEEIPEAVERAMKKIPAHIDAAIAKALANGAKIPDPPKVFEIK